MVPTDYKLCWLHNSSLKSSSIQPCEESLNKINLDISCMPSCHKDCSTYSRMLNMFNESGIPDKFWDYFPIQTPEEDRMAYRMLKSIREQITDFIRSGQNLFLYSEEYGNGKTLWSSILMKAYIRDVAMSRKYYKNLVRYVYIPDFIYRYMTCEKFNFDDIRRQSFFDKVHSLSDTKFVIWDGFGYGSQSSIENSVIRSVIHSRLNQSLSNMFISDKYDLELSDVIGSHMFNRIKSSSVFVEFKGESLRPTQLEQL